MHRFKSYPLIVAKIIIKKMEKLVFVEIRKNKFGRIWAIKKGRNIIHKGYNFSFGKELFNKLTERTNMEKHPYDKARERWADILAGKKPYWEVVEEILKKD